MSDFRIGDQVVFRGTVDSVHDDGCVHVDIEGGSGTTFFEASEMAEATLMSRPKTPGQIAFEAQHRAFGLKYHMTPWESLYAWQHEAWR